jgi:hypothetical protein
MTIHDGKTDLRKKLPGDDIRSLLAAGMQRYEWTNCIFTVQNTFDMSKQKFSPKGAAPTPMADRLIFGKKQYIIMGIGVLLIALGMLLMLGGKMPDPNTWDDSLIYSHRRITLAPLFIILGLIAQVYAIFAKDKTTTP